MAWGGRGQPGAVCPSKVEAAPDDRRRVAKIIKIVEEFKHAHVGILHARERISLRNLHAKNGGLKTGRVEKRPLGSRNYSQCSV